MPRLGCNNVIIFGMGRGLRGRGRSFVGVFYCYLSAQAYCTGPGTGTSSYYIYSTVQHTSTVSTVQSL